MKGKETVKQWKFRSISPKMYNDCIFDLINVLPKDKYQYVYGIPKGGVPVSIYICYQLQIEYLPILDPNLPKHKVLIADDITDTGKTLLEYVNRGYDTAVLYYKSRSLIKPTYHIFDASDYWIRFPYEKQDEIPNRGV
jgi:hypothetical protein